MANEIDYAWIAGLLEGDGSFYFSKNGEDSYISRIGLAMYDEDVVQRAADILGSKVTSYVIVRGGEEKIMYSTTLARKEDTKIFLNRILPYMGDRRSARIKNLLAHMED